MFIVKIGGSVITRKEKKYFFRQNIMDELAKYIKKANKDLIIVHGAGSFGHILAKDYSLSNGFKKKSQLQGFSKTHAMVQKLNSYVLESLTKYNIPAVSISPHSTLRFNDHELLKMDYKIFKDYLNENFIPVTYGDVVLDYKHVFSVCSGDLLVMKLSIFFKPEKVIFLIDEDGLYTSNPKKNKNAEFINSIKVGEFENLAILLDSHADVTGGMKGKIDMIKKISESGIDTVLINGNKPKRLYDKLIGLETKCTIIPRG